MVQGHSKVSQASERPLRQQEIVACKLFDQVVECVNRVSGSLPWEAVNVVVSGRRSEFQKQRIVEKRNSGASLVGKALAESRRQVP